MRSLADFPDAHLRIFDRPAPPSSVREVYLIGICGTGMGSLAGLLTKAGYTVRGSDANVWPPMSTHLASLDITVHEGFDPSHLDYGPDLVIVGNACTPTHVEAAAAPRAAAAPMLLSGSFSGFFSSKEALVSRRRYARQDYHHRTADTSDAKPGPRLSGWRNT